MTYLKKPKITHPELSVNELGLHLRDYEGAMSTLCAGCGHDSITAAIVQAFFELNIPPHTAVKVSGIGCSSKTPTYFLGQSHGFNSVHGRMPSIVSGANAANRSLTYIGVSGDGDSLSIGIGQLFHIMRRNVNMLYVIENNGVYGLTKGQFSASADAGCKSKRGDENVYPAIDAVSLALTTGATMVARSFSGDKKQLVPLVKAGLRHNGMAILDVISPCVAFNDHEGSTKSYQYTRRNVNEVLQTDFIPPTQEIRADYPPGSSTTVTLHDGSLLQLNKIAKNYDPTDRVAAYTYVQKKISQGEIVTGLLYIDAKAPDMHDGNQTVDTPLNQIPFEELCPGSETLETIQKRFR